MDKARGRYFAAACPDEMIQLRAAALLFKNPGVQIEELLLYVEERPANCKIKTGGAGQFYLMADIQLQPADYTVLTLKAPTFRPNDIGLGNDQRKIGVAVSEIVI
jgi:hypothetical protein